MARRADPLGINLPRFYFATYSIVVRRIPRLLLSLSQLPLGRQNLQSHRRWLRAADGFSGLFTGNLLGQGSASQLLLLGSQGYLRRELTNLRLLIHGALSPWSYRRVKSCFSSLTRRLENATTQHVKTEAPGKQS